MSSKYTIFGNTEEDFEAAFAQYTKAGNKTKAMRRFWNTAFELGKTAGLEDLQKQISAQEETNRLERYSISQEERRRGFEQGKEAGIELGRQAGIEQGKTGVNVAVLEAEERGLKRGKILGIKEGKDLGRQVELKRWEDAGHSERGKCSSSTQAVITTGVQTVENSAPPKAIATVETQTDSALDSPAKLDWADDASSIPIHAIPPQSFENITRDFSALRSGCTKPFGTLQRRFTRSRARSHRSSYIPSISKQSRIFTPPTMCTVSTIYPHQSPVITRRHPAGIAPGRPTVTIAPLTQPAITLDWDRDPRLADLGKALHALGWVRSC